MRRIEERVRQLPAVMESGDALRLLLQHNFICAPSIFLRTAATRRMITPAQAKWDWASDWFLSLLHAAAGKLAYDPEPLVRYRIHGSSMSHHPKYHWPQAGGNPSGSVVRFEFGGEKLHRSRPALDPVSETTLRLVAAARAGRLNGPACSTMHGCKKRRTLFTVATGKIPCLSGEKSRAMSWTSRGMD